MRVAPVGLFAPAIGEDVEVFRIASDAAALTHGHPSGYLAAGYLAVVVARLVRGEDLLAGLDAADRCLQGYRDASEVQRAVDAARTMASRGRPTPERLEELGGGWVAEEALAIAICGAMVARDFSDGVFLAVNHSGDSDSTGSIAGNLLGAHLGIGAIPSAWLDCLEMREEIDRVAIDLATTALGEREPDGAWQSYPGW
ncbi:ADP-ribosylation protein [Acidiphilium sp. JA12-A1]|nr:ADP-ribosylation protein [Acidiphilium sp. JA12-A1]